MCSTPGTRDTSTRHRVAFPVGLSASCETPDHFMCLCVSAAHGNGSSAHGSSLNAKKKKNPTICYFFFFLPASLMRNHNVKKKTTASSPSSSASASIHGDEPPFSSRYQRLVLVASVSKNPRRSSSRITGRCSNCPAMFAFSHCGMWSVTRWPGMAEQ